MVAGASLGYGPRRCLPRLPVATLSTLAYSHTDAVIESKTNGNILWQAHGTLGYFLGKGGCSAGRIAQARATYARLTFSTLFFTAAVEMVTNKCEGHDDANFDGNHAVGSDATSPAPGAPPR